eukprot:GHVU01187245.1.p1 GENE.GHVU01187245.1~~GHVU01187245.1.p1  ORF type:complete len:309 (+),score=28.28 GHVU01187245.1:333-1259(+)
MFEPRRPSCSSGLCPPRGRAGGRVAHRSQSAPVLQYAAERPRPHRGEQSPHKRGPTSVSHHTHTCIHPELRRRHGQRVATTLIGAHTDTHHITSRPITCVAACTLGGRERRLVLDGKREKPKSGACERCYARPLWPVATPPPSATPPLSQHPPLPPHCCRLVVESSRGRDDPSHTQRHSSRLFPPLGRAIGERRSTSSRVQRWGTHSAAWSAPRQEGTPQGKRADEDKDEDEDCGVWMVRVSKRTDKRKWKENENNSSSSSSSSRRRWCTRALTRAAAERGTTAALVRVWRSGGLRVGGVASFLANTE